jgi:hypothetical protein
VGLVSSCVEFPVSDGIIPVLRTKPRCRLGLKVLEPATQKKPYRSTLSGGKRRHPQPDGVLLLDRLIYSDSGTVNGRILTVFHTSFGLNSVHVFYTCLGRFSAGGRATASEPSMTLWLVLMLNSEVDATPT